MSAGQGSDLTLFELRVEHEREIAGQAGADSLRS